MNTPYCEWWPTVADSNVVPFATRERRARLKNRAEVDRSIREADAALAEWRDHDLDRRRAEIEAFVNSLNPYSERTRKELIEKLL